MTPPNDPHPTHPIPTQGELRLRVRYPECDPMGLAHHGSYPAWLEMGRTELLRQAGVSYADLERAGVFLVITRLDIRYRAPARYDDQLLLLTRVAGGRRARIDHEYELWLDQQDGRGKAALLAQAATTLACVGHDARPRPLPDWLTPDAHAGPAQHA